MRNTFLAKSLAHQRSRDRQHLSHSGAALRAFIADHHHVSGHDLSSPQSVHDLLFLVEHLGRARPSRPELVACDFQYAPLRREVAEQGHESAGAAERGIDRLHDVRIAKIGPITQVFLDRIARHGHAVPVKKARLEQALHHYRHAAHPVEVEHQVSAAWLHIGKQRRAHRDVVDVFQGQFHVNFVCDRRAGAMLSSSSRPSTRRAPRRFRRLSS